ncbi:MAG: maleylpyruvate isomerase family mycothiol-dependent enzyme [Marmoricola sp.]
MTSLAARTIAALRTEHDTLAALVPTLTDDQLTGPSGASEWSCAQVLSHLGSGSEISLASLRGALGEAEPPADDFNQSVWARWDSSTPQEQRDGFLEHNLALVKALEALSDEQHATLQIKLGFLPAPISVASYAGMRLNEVAHHGWDVRVAGDAGAGLLGTSTDVLLDHVSGDLGFLLGFIGKADLAPEHVVLDIGSSYRVLIDDTIGFGSATDEPTATFTGAPEAALRLLFGRLGPAYTPAGVEVVGNITLDELRAVFPGF